MNDSAILLFIIVKPHMLHRKEITAFKGFYTVGNITCNALQTRFEENITVGNIIICKFEVRCELRNFLKNFVECKKCSGSSIKTRFVTWFRLGTYFNVLLHLPSLKYHLVVCISENGSVLESPRPMDTPFSRQNDCAILSLLKHKFLQDYTVLKDFHCLRLFRLYIMFEDNVENYSMMSSKKWKT